MDILPLWSIISSFHNLGTWGMLDMGFQLIDGSPISHIPIYDEPNIFSKCRQISFITALKLCNHIAGKQYVVAECGSGLSCWNKHSFPWKIHVFLAVYVAPKPLYMIQQPSKTCRLSAIPCALMLNHTNTDAYIWTVAPTASWVVPLISGL